MRRAACRVIEILAALIVTLVVAFSQSSAAGSGALNGWEGAPLYTYDAPRPDQHSDHAAPERGPPAPIRHSDVSAGQPAVGLESLGASARLITAPVASATSEADPGSYAYDQPGSPAQIDTSAGTTEKRSGASEDAHPSRRPGHVAAKTGSSALDSLAPAVRSNVDAISRAASGKVRFTGHDGKVYNNSDGLLPRGGSYTEWTAAEAGAKRGAHRVIIEGDPASPNAICYWDHVNPPVRFGP